MKQLLTCTALFFFMTIAVTAQQRLGDSAGDFPITNSQNALRTLMVLPVISFDEHPVNHNMHITSDGDYYYAINGGSSSSGQINKFDMNGNLLQTYPIMIDGRGLSYNNADGFLYASLYAGDIVRITDLATGAFTPVFSAIMQNAQGSFAISTDGSKFYNFSLGTLNIHDFVSGAVLNTIPGLQFGAGNFGGEGAVAVDASRIFTWNATIKTVYIYDTTGTLMQTMPLDSGDNGHSLSIANGFLFVSKDGNYSMGTWYGYNIPGTSGIDDLQSEQDSYNIFPNPAGIIAHIKGSAIKVTVTDLAGKTILSMEEMNNPEIDVSTFPTGIYIVRIDDKESVFYRKLMVE